jgi:hypothetical protein
MPLTKLQRRRLIAYRRFRDQGGPSGRDLLDWPLLLWAAGVTLFGVVLLLGGVFAPGALLVGMAVGGLTIGYVNARRAFLAWPTILMVMDWQRVDQLLEEDERSRSAAG